MYWWCSWWSARACHSFHKEAWWEWDHVHKTWQMYCWLFLRQIHQWQAQNLARHFQRKRYQFSSSTLNSWVWRRKTVSDGADFLGEVIRKDIRKVVRVKCWRKRWRTAFAEDDAEILKELFTGCARLNLCRVIGLVGCIYMVCYFCWMESWTVSLDLSHRLSACRRSRFSSQNSSVMLLNQGVGFLVRPVQRQRGACLSMTKQRWLL